MCGLTGILDLRKQRPIDRGCLSRMNQAQVHRGPDEEGIYVQPGIGLAHRRLSIIDLSSGQQPLFNEDGSVVVVYNGEIYNFPELARELETLGHRFRTHSDTEVIVHAWEQWGDDCVTRFRGMFAFALWDANRRCLFLARDRLGIKPLYYARTPDGHLVFGSELKSLLAFPGLPRELNEQAVEEYFAFGYVPDPGTILRHVNKLPPGHALLIEAGREPGQPRSWWDVPFERQTVSEADAVEELTERLREAVKVRLVSEVPLGAFLSGGVDSSAVVALMAGLNSGQVNTCSISFREQGYDESDYAQQVADRYQTDHHVEQVSADATDLVDRLADLYDEPFADSSAMPTYRVCALARRRVTVALSGDGGDENLAGYRRYYMHLFEERMRGRLPLPLRRAVFGRLARWYPKLDRAPRMFRAKATFWALARDSIEGYFHGISYIPDMLRNDLYAPAFRSGLQGYNAVEVLRRHAQNAPVDDPLSLVQYLDLKTYLPGDILTKVDRASMANSLEVRVPILDHPLVEWMSGLPPELKLRGREGKYLFKQALRPYLPKDILYRPKMGFGVPLAEWFRGPLRQRVQDALLTGALPDSGLFNNRFIARLIENHLDGVRDHSTPLWTLLMFDAFYRRVLNP